MAKQPPLELGLSSDPRMPAAWDAPLAYAIKAIYEGRASDHQQKMFAAFLERLCGIHDLEFRVDERMSAFASGKRFVGLQIRKLATMHPEILAAVQKKTGANS